MKRGVRIERFRLWKVKPAGVARHDDRRERLEDILKNAAAYFGVDAREHRDVPKTMTFVEALHYMASSLGIKAFQSKTMTWRVPMIARDKRSDEAVLLIPRGRFSYDVINDAKETISQAKIVSRFDEIYFLQRSSKPYGNFETVTKKIVAQLPITTVVVIALVLTLLSLAWVKLVFLLQSDFGELNRLVFIPTLLGLALVISGISSIGNSFMHARFSANYLWLFDQFFRRFLKLSAEQLARISGHEFEMLARGVHRGIANLFFTWPRLILASAGIIFSSIALFAESTPLAMSFVVCACGVGGGIALIQKTKMAQQQTYYEQREHLFKELERYANSRQAIFGLGLTAESTGRLSTAMATMIDAHDGVERLDFRLKISYLFVPIGLPVLVLLLSGHHAAAWPPYRLATMVAIIVSAGFAIVYVAERSYALLHYGFDKAVFKAIARLPGESLRAHVEPVETAGALELIHISYAHEDSGHVVLRDFSVTIAPHDCVLICGPSGSGKTTLLKILCGLNRPHEGEIIFDGQDLRALNENSLRNKFGVVFENAELFAGSIYNNILCGRDISPKVLESLLLSHEVFDVLLDMPMALETYILERGHNISRLERMSILLARALIHRPSFLFLDEIFGGLSLKDQNIIGDYLNSLSLTRIVTSLSPNIPLTKTKTIILPTTPHLG